MTQDDAETKLKLDAIAWKFLGSEFAGQTYADWPIERRLDGYLLHHGLVDIFNDGGACEALLERVMDNLGRAVRAGLLPPMTHRSPGAEYADRR